MHELAQNSVRSILLLDKLKCLEKEIEACKELRSMEIKLLLLLYNASSRNPKYRQLYGVQLQEILKYNQKKNEDANCTSYKRIRFVSCPHQL